MKRLKKGPELKMPDLKVPDFLKDVFYDLHDRRLLAPLLLVVVAILAVPFLLGGGSEESETAPVTGAAIVTGEAEAAKSASFTVVEAKPGLRDYRKRLAAREPTNPFKQRYTSTKTEGAQLSEGDETSSTAETVTTSSSTAGTVTTSSSSETTGSSPSYTPPTSSPPPAQSGDGKPHLTFFTWAIDVRISRSTGGERVSPGEDQEPVVKTKVLPQTAVPGPKAPVVTYMGLSRKAADKNSEKVLLLISSDVEKISGDRACSSGTSTHICELIEVAPGSPVTFLYGAGEVSYTINVLKTELVVTGHG